MFINCQRRGFSATGKLVTSLLWVVVSITGFLLIGVVAHFLGDLTSGEFVAFDVPIASFSIFSLVFSLSIALFGLVDGGQRTELIPLFILASGALLGMPHASARLSLRLVSGGKERTRNDRNNTSAACSTGS